MTRQRRGRWFGMGSTASGGLGHRGQLKWRLVALFVLLALATTAVFVLGTRQWFSASWQRYVRPLATDYVDRLSDQIGSPPDVAQAQALVQRLPLSIRIQGPAVNWASDPPPEGGSDRVQAHGAESDRAGRPWRSFGGEDQHNLVVRETADGHRISFALHSGAPNADPERRHWGLVAVLLLIVGAAFWAVRRLFRPVDEIRAGALRFGAGDFSQPIAVRRPDELGTLAQQVNAMAENLQRMLEGQRGLLLAISHELRSPLTRARLNAELAPEGPERDALLRDLAVMRDLISDLLESERLAGGGTQLQRDRVDLGTLVREQVAQHVADRQAGAAGAPLQALAAPVLRLPASGPQAWVDPVRIRLLLRNLLNNAWQHGGDQAVAVELTVVDEPPAGGRDGVPADLPLPAVRLRVDDRGPGLGANQRSRLAQPFFRPDAARSRSSGGVGLGLYLCRLVCESHGGRLLFHDLAPGLRAECWLPVDPLPQSGKAAPGARV